MPDAFDEELDKGPEGSILQPIFLGCSAMGIGCLFSVGAVALAIFVFFPGIWSLLNAIDENTLMDQSLPQVRENPIVVERVGEPMEAEFDDFDAVEDSSTVNYQFGEEIDLFNTYRISGPNGSAKVEAIGTFSTDGEELFEINSIIVTFDDGEQLRVFPSETDTPPPPQQLAPPAAEIPAIEADEPEGAEADDANAEEADAPSRD